MKLLLSLFLTFNFVNSDSETNFEQHLNKLCEQRNVSFQRGILDPFNDYIDELPIEGANYSEKYLNYLNYLAENDSQHQTVPAFLDSLPNDRFWSIKLSLTELGIIKGDFVNYEILIKLLKKTRPKDLVIKDFIGVFKEIGRHDHNVSPGLIADGIVFSLDGATLDNKTYQQVTVLTVSAFAVMGRNGL